MFQNNIRRVRLMRDLTQEELAIKAGVSRNYIWMLEKGHRRTSDVVKAKLAEALEVKVSELFNFDQIETSA